MKISELITTHTNLDEGMWVIKSKDGVEKRFKNADSPEAVAWKEKIAKKPPKAKAEKHSQEYWEAQEDKNPDTILPWTRITLGLGHGELSSEELEKVGEHQGFGNVYDFHKLRTGETKIDGVYCATIELRVVVVYTKDDDLGIESDEPVSDSYNIIVRRDTKNPTSFVFVRFA